MSRVRLYTAIVAAIILAIPVVTFVSALVVFPLLVYALFAIVANFAPLVILAARGARKLGRNVDVSQVVEAWKYSAIIWVGCAFGLSRWGDVASTMGATNTPYLKVLLAPYLFILGIPVA